MLSKIIAENFLSWDKLEFNVDNGVTLIDGFNVDDQTSEGSGKSAILNALCWGLYGKIPKDAKIDDVIKIGKKSCTVAVELSSGDIIVRTRKPNDLFVLYENEKTKGKDAKETQKLIENLVGLSFETFCQTVYFAQNYDKKFITSNQEEKAKILSEVQDLQIFDRSRKEVMALLKVEEKGLNDLKTQLQLKKKDAELVEKDIAHNLEHKKAVEHFKKQQLEQKLTQLNALDDKINQTKNLHQELVMAVTSHTPEDVEGAQNKITELSGQAREIQLSINNIDDLRKQRANRESLGAKYGKRYQQLTKEVEQLEEFLKNPTEICPTCGTALGEADPSHAENNVADNKKEMADLMGLMTDIAKELETPIQSNEELQTQLTQLKEEIGRYQFIYDTFMKNQRAHDQDIANMKAAEKALGELTAEALKTATEYKELENAPVDDKADELLSHRAKLSQIVVEMEAIENLVKEKQIQVGMLEELKAGFKEVKTHVFNSMLNEINARVNQYLQKLFEMPVSMEFSNDNMKIETNVIVDGTSRGLGLLSGGQFRRVSLATDLALSDVISARKNSKLGVLILDEYFKDLSESSMEKCLDLLQQRKQPVILIEHNSIFKNIIDNTFFVKLEKGTSYEQI